MPVKPRKYTKPKAKTTVKKSKPVSEKRIRAIAKGEIAKNVEDKFTNSVTLLGTTLTISSGEPPILTHYNFNPFSQGMFNIIQGPGNSERIGNTIKLKRWVIKGTVYSTGGLTNGGPGNPMQCAVVDLYFGRNRDMTVPFDASLPFFYQDGNSATTPQGELLERCASVNRDNYVIYKHHRVKIGPSTSSAVTPAQNNNNNDYHLSYDFGFDICKLIAKNHKIKFADDAPAPNDALLRSLTLWCTITYANVDIDITEQSTMPVYIAAQSYAQYEDA